MITPLNKFAVAYYKDEADKWIRCLITQAKNSFEYATAMTFDAKIPYDTKENLKKKMLIIMHWMNRNDRYFAAFHILKTTATERYLRFCTISCHGGKKAKQNAARDLSRADIMVKIGFSIDEKSIGSCVVAKTDPVPNESSDSKKTVSSIKKDILNLYGPMISATNKCRFCQDDPFFFCNTPIELDRMNGNSQEYDYVGVFIERNGILDICEKEINDMGIREDQFINVQFDPITKDLTIKLLNDNDGNIGTFKIGHKDTRIVLATSGIIQESIQDYDRFIYRYRFKVKDRPNGLFIMSCSRKLRIDRQ